MSSYTINWVGHVLNPAEHHDKIWGYMTTSGGGVYTFWAGRGKPIQFKRMPSTWTAQEVRDTKASKRKDPYRVKSVEQMSILWPEFNEHLESCYAMAKLSGKIRTDE
jgi:hypothetical protein